MSLLFFAVGCYVYKPYVADKDIENAQESEQQQAVSLRKPNPSQGKTMVDPDKQKAPLVPAGDELKRKEEEIKKRQQQEEIKAIEEELKKAGNDDSEMLQLKRQEMVKTMEEDQKKQQETEPSPDIVQAQKESLEGGNSAELKAKIHPNKYYKITVADKQYKIQAEQWEGDTLVSHKMRKPEKVLKFHHNQIDQENLLERRFSKPYSDLITVGSYVAVGAAVLLLLL